MNEMNNNISEKLKLLSDLFKCVNDLSEMRVNVNSVSVKTSENVLNIWDNNCGKMCRISTESKKVDNNCDNKNSYKCDECGKCLKTSDILKSHKDCVHLNRRKYK